jgi:GT2 family glycosyltransferase
MNYSNSLLERMHNTMNQHPLAQHKKALVIGVNYNSSDAVIEFISSLQSIQHHPGVDISLILVDNSDREESSSLSERIAAIDSTVVYLKAATNLGYFGGARYGLEYSQVHGGNDYDWYVISNVDVVFHEKDFFQQLNAMDDNAHLGIVAPAIWSKRFYDDRNPHLVTRLPFYKIQFYTWLYKRFILQFCYQKLSVLKRGSLYLVKKILESFPHIAFLNQPKRKSMQSIYSPQGACIIFTRAYFMKGGSLNHPAFLYAEELFVAETAKQLGLSVIYNPQLNVLHKESISTREIDPRLRAKYVSESMEAIASLYYTIDRKQALAIEERE